MAAVAIGLDLAVLGLWMSDHTLFPFFQRWDSQTGSGVIDRAIGVWLVLLLVHFVLLLVSIVVKHFHGDRIESVDSAALADLFQAGWLGQNRWMLIGNWEHTRIPGVAFKFRGGDQCGLRLTGR